VRKINYIRKTVVKILIVIQKVSQLTAIVSNLQ